MNTSKMMPMKGLLKGLRYISHIFDNEKEEEIQIGLPTDVKHVAHIGMDGPSAHTPSWMNKYTTNSETTPVSPKGESENNPSTISSCKDPVQRSINLDHKSSSAPLDSPTQLSSRKPRHVRGSSNSSVGSEDEDSVSRSKPRRNKYSGDIGSPGSERTRRNKYSGEIGSPTPERTRRSKYSGDITEDEDSVSRSKPRRNKHSGDIGSPASERTRRSKYSGDITEDEDSVSRSKPRRNKYSGEIGSPTSERTRRSKYSGDIGSMTSERTRRSKQYSGDIGSDPPTLENPPKIPKSRQKKSKESSDSGSLRSSRPKVPDSFPESSPYYSDPGFGQVFENNKACSHTVYDEGKECEEISRGIRAL